MTTWLHAEQEAHVELLKPLVLPVRYANPAFDKLPTQKLKDKALEYMKGFWEFAPNGIAPLLVGVAETGKTFTAALIAKGIYHRYRINVTWCNAASEFVRFERTLFSPETAERIEQLKNASFLVLDDLAQIAQYPKALALVLEILTARFDAMRPTLVTANIDVGKHPAKVFDDTFGVCLGRRLMESSEGFRVLTG